MSNFVTVTGITSIEKEVIPYIKDCLETTGYGVVNILPSKNLASDMLIVTSLIGKELGKYFSYHFLEGEEERDYLAAHTEGIAYTNGIVPYFALGCLTPAHEGGATRIFDGKKAARLAQESGLSDVLFEYNSLAHPNQVVRYPLVINDPVYGNVLRYRAKVVTNKILNDNFSEDFVYAEVNNILEDCVSCVYSWEVGDIVFMNNKFTLHDRLPYRGRRHMLRVRYDDGLHRNFSF